jgi:hypothetical protein
MPHGFFTAERWRRPPGSTERRWIPIFHLDSCQSLSKAIAALEKRGQPGLYRIVQTQRCIWAETEGGKLRLHGSHISSPEHLGKLTEFYEREGGRRPVEKARQERAQAKANRLGNGEIVKSSVSGGLRRSLFQRCIDLCDSLDLH